MKAVQQEQEECVAILLEHGADPNLADADGNTALHLAVLSKNTAVAGLLLEHNAKSDAQNQCGFTPLKLAAFLQHEEILQCLLEKAAGGHAQAQCERTALVLTGTHEAHTEEDNLRLQKELDGVDAEVRELSQQLHMEPKTGVQLEAPNQGLQEEPSTLCGKCGKLENSECQLQEEMTKLHRHLETFPLDGSQTEPCKREVEERADQEISQKLQDVSLVLQPQAAYQPRLGQIGDTACDSVGNQLEERIRHLERELDRVKKIQEESASPKGSTHGDMAMYKDLYLEEVKTRRCLANKVERLEKLLREAFRRELRVNEENETQSQQEEMRKKYSEKVMQVYRLQTKVCELSQQLDRESKKCKLLEAKTQDLQEELSTLRGKCENLEMDKCQLQEELAKLQQHLETNTVDRSQLQQFQREVQQRADQEITQKLQGVNQFLKEQAASQDRLEQIRASHFNSLRNRLEDRIKDLERELARTKSNQRERPFQSESRQAKVDKYRELYREEVKTGKRLAETLERTQERLAEANAELLWERRRRRSAVTSSTVSTLLSANLLLDSAAQGHRGNRLGWNSSLGLGTQPSHMW